MGNQNIVDTVRHLVHELSSKSSLAIADDVHVIQSGFFRSLDFLKLLVELEETFQIKIITEDFEIDRFTTIASMSTAIEQLKTSSSEPMAGKEEIANAPISHP